MAVSDHDRIQLNPYQKPSLKDLQETIRGRLLPLSKAQDAAAILLGNICCDSGRTRPGEVFWTLLNAAGDGACLVHEAFRRGAQGAIATNIEEVPERCWALVVDDTRQALVRWAQWHRRHVTATVVAVAGCTALSTTRHLIQTVLRTKLHGSKSYGSNIHNIAYDKASVPLSVLAIEPDHDYAVIELNATRPEEMQQQIETCLPKLGVVMSLAAANMESFGSRQTVNAVIGRLLSALPDEGLAVLADDSWLHGMSACATAPITWIGTSPTCGLRAVEVTRDRAKLRFQLADKDGIVTRKSKGRSTPVTFSLNMWGRPHIDAALAAIAVGRSFGFDLEEIATAMARYQAVKIRCEIEEIGGAYILNEAAGGGSGSMKEALAMLREFDAPGRRVVLCGDMTAVEQNAIALHWLLGRELVTVGGAELIIACGRFARHVTAGARATGLIRSRAVPCDTLEEAMPIIAQAILPGDIVLVKASPVMAMQKLVDAYRAFAPKPVETLSEKLNVRRRA